MKNRSLAVLLALLFPPLGLFYASVRSALWMIVALFFVTYLYFKDIPLGATFHLVWWICCAGIAYFEVEEHNRKYMKSMKECERL